MIHSKWLTVEVRGEQRLWMAGRRQVRVDSDAIHSCD
jgi:hypothetical protein